MAEALNDRIQALERELSSLRRHLAASGQLAAAVVGEAGASAAPRAVVGESILAFSAGDVRLGLRLGEVLEVVRMVEPTPLADASPGILGAIDYRGTIMPLLDLAVRLGRPARAFGLDSKIIVAKTAGRQFGAVVDEVQGLVPVTADAFCSDAKLSMGEVPVERRCLLGALRAEGGLLLVLDLAGVLSWIPAEPTAAKDGPAEKAPPARRKRKDKA